MRRLICAFVVRLGQKQFFSWQGLFYNTFALFTHNLAKSFVAYVGDVRQNEAETGLLSHRC